MEVSDVVEILESAREPDRMYDGYIGTLFGWRRNVEYVTKSGSSEPVKKVTWLSPSGEPGIVPSYTTSIETALQLAETIVPIGSWAASWSNGKGRAQIGEGAVSEGLTPAMALCIVALKILRQNR